MSSKLKQVLDVSLDDYIAEKGIVSLLRPSLTPKQENFKRQMRSEIEDDEEEDELLEIVNDKDTNAMDFEAASEKPKDEFGIVEDRTPTDLSIQIDSKDEIHSFVTEEKKRGIKHMPSQQWRLQRQNQVYSKPRGVPPLTSVKAVFDQNTEQLIASLGENAKFCNNNNNRFFNHRNNGGNNNYNRNRNHMNNNRYHNMNNNRNHMNNNRNWNNRNQQGRNTFRNHNFNPRQDQQNQQQDQSRNPMNNVRDLRTLINGQLPQTTMVSGTNHFNQPQLVTFADMLNRIGQTSSAQERETFADVFRNIMRSNQQQQQQPAQQGSMVRLVNSDTIGQMNANELMPYAANTLLNHITTVCQNFGPKYDMKVQKDIHALQGKAMMYSSAGVVTMDGPGIDSERVKPKTTDLSMNMRFC